MAHVNQQVRGTVKAGLAATSIAAKSTFTNLSADLHRVDLPAALIGTDTDEVALYSKGTSGSGPHELRTLDLTIVLVTDGESETLDDDLDALRSEVEPVVVSSLASLAKRLEHRGGAIDTGHEEDGDRWFGFLALSWRVEIVTEQGNPEVAL